MHQQTLETMTCVPCHAGESQVSTAELLELHRQVPDWHVVNRDGLKSLERTFKFYTFNEALEFADKVGQLATHEGHTPAILVEWGKARVSWWTDAIHGLHRNDFVMAAKTDHLYAEFMGQE